MKQREIKFRALFDSGAVKKWMKSGLNDEVWISQSFACACTRLSPWLQYTGRRDKRGSEIYDGDVIDSMYGRCVVGWNEKECGWEMREPDGFGYTLDESEEHKLSVIGNIYENPELLNP